MQILAFLARRGKGGADRLTGKNRDAVKLALDGTHPQLLLEDFCLTYGLNMSDTLKSCSQHANKSIQ